MELFYLGPEGTHSHDAALRLRDAMLPSATVTACPTIPTVIDRTLDAVAGEGLACVPIENSIQGAVAQTWDTLMKSAADGVTTQSLSILAALTLPIHHYAIYPSGTSFDDVVTVYSHPQALAQCQHHLTQMFPNALPVATNSTAEAVQYVAKEAGRDGAAQTSAVAIAGRRAAERYGLIASDDPIEDQPGNATRFALVAPVGRAAEAKGDLLKLSVPGEWALAPEWTYTEYVVSLCLHGVAHCPGGLVGALSPFAQAGLNLGRVESRPVGDQLGNYVFYLDVSFPPQMNVAEITTYLSPVTRQLADNGVRIVQLGSYPIYQVQ
ncbi:prephenate dehydratase [Alicyclobacillus acidoterrestris]|uniref:prephenate dehydratase n=1 Tax=Alicyclobacillus acidoterrestris (strain ATCC 49025 / DSM 3922 / CIP 106132 / NCIMB 13137 / GD3B) TaxID=1356854 RepID=T0BZK6_ALIAG|nr:prephenate dehydratase domain-containing protein [Alicyclobacillus acidoterrestris]EPZ46229.1 hypothetical protein N007_06970 [Alicyclobacillus acidoterrestris ATCC 49025]UNO47136.1 prephenate dehydratase [Alicyclobacillus acidoterrestris]